MPRQDYIPRIVDDRVRQRLSVSGAIVLEGPKACGKTLTASQFSKSEVLLDVDPDAPRLAQIVPKQILDGETPRLIDEWQLVPSLWNAIRRAVDDRSDPGQFILTGSSTPQADARRHSGAGRMSRIRMRPMTLWESGHSSGDTALSSLKAGERAAGRCSLEVADYVELIVRGGWPKTVNAPLAQAVDYVYDYVANAFERPVMTANSTRHDPLRFERFLRAYAQVTAQPTPLTRIISRVVGSDAPAAGRHASPTWHTADSYRDSAAQAMLIEDLPAWSPQLRSRTRLTEVPKRHFVDPSLSAGLLGADRDRLLRDPNTLGYLFESLALRDIRVYAEASDGKAFHYRERNGMMEVDIVVEWRDGTWIGIEVKLGETAIDNAAQTLMRMASRRVAQKPAALIVLTATEYAYCREDGVQIVPLGSLRP